MEGIFSAIPVLAGLWCGLAAGAIGLAVLLARAHRRPVFSRRGAVGNRLAGDESGTATIEFVLVFPILLVLILLLVQVTLLMVGNLYVHYAAFAATRAAIVWVPAATGGEAVNVIHPDARSSKYRAIRRAAAGALIPVCGRLESGGGSGIDPAVYADALRDHFDEGGGDRPAWVDKLVEQKVRYANANTEINLLVYDPDEPDDFALMAEQGHLFGPRDPVTVRVRHRLNLAVPYVRLFFADGEHETVTGPGGYTLVEAQTTLTNQGVDPAMPEPPSVRRVP